MDVCVLYKCGDNDPRATMRVAGSKPRCIISNCSGNEPETSSATRCVTHAGSGDRDEFLLRAMSIVWTMDEWR